MTTRRLTYCGNVHAAETFETWIESVEAFSVAIAAGRQQPFGLGAWWNASTARRLAHDETARHRVRSLLDDHGLTIWTLNVFPYGEFHAGRVKTEVYRPDWSSTERLEYTRHAAEALGGLLSPGASIPLSTLPLGYAEGDLHAMAENLAQVVGTLADIEARTGVHQILLLEPEPFCLVETVGQAAAFLEDRLFEPGDGSLPEDVLRRHLGVCVDLCHLAVVGEDPLLAMADLSSRGIRFDKIQLSSCLEVRDPATGLDRLLAFDEPRYLHQTVSADGKRALDLDEVRSARQDWEGAESIRTHFHMPLFWDEEGAFGSTRREVERVIRGLEDPMPLLEIETYTWSVLEDLEMESGGLVDGIRREFAFVDGLLDGE